MPDSGQVVNFRCGSRAVRQMTVSVRSTAAVRSSRRKLSFDNAIAAQTDTRLATPPAPSRKASMTMRWRRRTGVAYNSSLATAHGENVRAQKPFAGEAHSPPPLFSSSSRKTIRPARRCASALFGDRCDRTARRREDNTGGKLA